MVWWLGCYTSIAADGVVFFSSQLYRRRLRRIMRHIQILIDDSLTIPDCAVIYVHETLPLLDGWSVYGCGIVFRWTMWDIPGSFGRSGRDTSGRITCPRGSAARTSGSRRPPGSGYTTFGSYDHSYILIFKRGMCK